MEFTSNTITGNVFGIILDNRNSGVGSGVFTMDLYNNIIWANWWYDLVLDTRTITNASFSDIDVIDLGQLNYEGIYNDRGGNITATPFFFNSAEEDYRL